MNAASARTCANMISATAVAHVAAYLAAPFPVHEVIQNRIFILHFLMGAVLGSLMGDFLGKPKDWALKFGLGQVALAFLLNFAFSYRPEPWWIVPFALGQAHLWRSAAVGVLEPA